MPNWQAIGDDVSVTPVPALAPVLSPRPGPGGPGRLPARGSHRPERAQLTHSVPQATPSLYRDLASAVVNPVCAIRQRYGDTHQEFDASLCCLPTVELPDAPLPSPGSQAVQVPRLPRYYQGAMTSCRSSRRASFPSLGGTTQALVFRPHAAERDRGRSPGVGHPVAPAGSSSVETTGSPTFLGNPDCALALLSDPGRTNASGHAMHRRGPRYVHGEGSRIAAFEAQSHGFGTGCLRFAGRVAPTPRKTRFRLLAKLFRTGLITRRVPSKGFKVYPTSILLSQVQRSARTPLVFAACVNRTFSVAWSSAPLSSE
jgi:hypothetical protein